jgi:glutaminyl-tRNA synthetase
MRLEHNISIRSVWQNLLEEQGQAATFPSTICTRFPPEPNGYLHIGSAYAININYKLAKETNGHFNLRFDDTNPVKENIKYVNSIIEDIKWLGYNPDNVYYGSDYSDIIYDAAITLIKNGMAFVCDLSPAQITEYRGTLTQPGKNSPFRNRSVEENLDLFERMKKGEFADSAKVLRAKINMASPNINLRDPVIFRIIHAKHYRLGYKWCIYPMYDFAHPIQDAIEGITYSLCSIEFRDHRPLYKWVINELNIPTAPKQREFGRLNLTGVVTSKRYLRELVAQNSVNGWDDPRMPTIRGLRRRGYTPDSIKNFVHELGLIRNASTVDSSMLENSLRQDLKKKVPAVMAILNPLKVVITNYPDNKTELLDLENNSQNPELGKRQVPFSKTLYIERDDFMEIPSKGFHRLTPDSEVRLKGAYFITCHDIIKDEATGEIAELHCTYDPITKSGTGFTARKVKATIHWVSAHHGIYSDIHLYGNLFNEMIKSNDENPDWNDKVNPHSLVILKDCIVEPSLASAKKEDKFQFIRHGYFCVDSKYSTEDKLVFNRTVSLKDSRK